MASPTKNCFSLLLLLLLLLLLSIVLEGFSVNSTRYAIKSAVPSNDKPIIGIVAQETFGKFVSYGKSNVVASYVKYLESAGSRVIPIKINQTEEYYQKIFNSINGVLYPGGGQDLIDSGYANAGRTLYKLAIEANDKGDYFPLWGTCLGFELLTVLTSGQNLLTSTDAIKVSYSLNLLPGYDKSRLLNKDVIPPEILKTLTTENMTFNYHSWGLSPKNFTSNEKLSQFYNVLSTNKDEKGVEFISVMEANDYPFYAVQWHPEKNIFEWLEEIDHSPEAVRASLYMTQFFVEEARKSHHTFADKTEESKHLIYNYSPIYMADKTLYEQVYFIDV